MSRYVSVKIDGTDYPIALIDFVVSAGKAGFEVEVEPYKMSREGGIKAWWVTKAFTTQVFENGALRDITDEERWEWMV